MGRSQETYNKKEREKKKQKKKEAKARRKEERKNNPEDKGDNITYVDAYGNFSSTPPDPVEKVKANDISVSIPRKEDRQYDEEEDVVRKGTVTFYNSSKGYGFIKDKGSQQSIFVHANGLMEPITEGNTVTFEIEKGQKGPVAVKVKVLR